jgi:hypothetical protein
LIEKVPLQQRQRTTNAWIRVARCALMAVKAIAAGRVRKPCLLVARAAVADERGASRLAAISLRLTFGGWSFDRSLELERESNPQSTRSWRVALPIELSKWR